MTNLLRFLAVLVISVVVAAGADYAIPVTYGNARWVFWLFLAVPILISLIVAYCFRVHTLDDWAMYVPALLLVVPAVAFVLSLIVGCSLQRCVML